MTWQEVIIESLRIISCTIIAVVLIRVLGHLMNQFSLFRQNLKIESQKQKNAITLINARKNNEPKESIAITANELKEIVKNLNNNIKASDEATKQDLEKAKAQIEIYEKFLNKKV